MIRRLAGLSDTAAADLPLRSRLARPSARPVPVAAAIAVVAGPSAGTALFVSNGNPATRPVPPVVPATTSVVGQSTAAGVTGGSDPGDLPNRSGDQAGCGTADPATCAVHTLPDDS